MHLLLNRTIFPFNYHDESYEIRTGDYSGKYSLYLKEKRNTNIIKFHKINTPLPLYKYSSYFNAVKLSRNTMLLSFCAYHYGF